jgi:hypothetical protein
MGCWVRISHGASLCVLRHAVLACYDLNPFSINGALPSDWKASVKWLMRDMEKQAWNNSNMCCLMTPFVPTFVSRWFVFVISFANRGLWWVRKKRQENRFLGWIMQTVTRGINCSFPDSEQRELSIYWRIVRAECLQGRKLFILCLSAKSFGHQLQLFLKLRGKEYICSRYTWPPSLTVEIATGIC